VRTTAEQRHRRILEVVQERGSVRVAELGTELGVAQVTARRDVETLATRGLLNRVHGSVSWPQRGPNHLPSSIERGRPASGANRENSSPVLGMLVPSTTYYFAAVIQGAQTAASAAGARLMLGISSYRPSEDGAQVGRLLESGVDGLLLTPSWAPDAPVAEQADHFIALGVPCVLVERRVSPASPAAELDRVCSDHTHGALLALRHLTGLGHHRIALAARKSPAATAVRAGYLTALDALGLGEPPVAVIDTCAVEADPAGFDAAVERLFDAVHLHGVTAVLVHNDVDAIMLVQRLLNRGLRVPDDVSMIAYDDEVAALADTPLSAVAPPKREVGAAAVELLLSRLAEERDLDRTGLGRAPRRHLDLLPQLTIRDSCRPAPSGKVPESTA
jgi:DNA-binding LacI/PurR family transcriptional regulator